MFNVDLPCRVKSSQLGIISNKQSSTSAIVKPQPSSCSYICQHCLVHLGDIGELAQININILRWIDRLMDRSNFNGYGLFVILCNPQHGTATRPARLSRTTDMQLNLFPLMVRIYFCISHILRHTAYI